MKQRTLRKGWLLALSALIVFAMTLTACGGGAGGGDADAQKDGGDTAQADDTASDDTSSDDSGKDDGAAEGEITLDFWSNHPGSSKAAEEEIIANFEKDHPNIKIKLTDAGKNYEEVAQKYNAALSGGQLPDVIVVSDVTWFNFALNDQLTPLDTLFKDLNIDTSDYVDALYNDYILKDNHYALPYSRSTPLFYYNKEVWAKAGLEDRGPKTWKELVEWAPKISEAMGGKPAFVIPDGSNYLDWYSQGMFWSMGGAFSKEWEVTLETPESIAVGEFFQKAVKDGAIKLTKSPVEQFVAGEAGSFMESTGSLAGVRDAAKFDWQTAFLPGWEETESCPTGGAGIAIAAGIDDDRKAAAATFIEYLTNPQSTVIFTHATGYMPVRKSASDLPEQKKYMEEVPQAAVAIEQLAHTKSQDAARVFVPGGGMKLGAMLDKIAQGADVADTFKATAMDLQEAIDADIKPKL